MDRSDMFVLYIISFLFFFVVFLIVGSVFFYDYKENMIIKDRNEFCRDRNFTVGGVFNVEQGYIKCCNKTYKNHIFDGYACKIFEGQENE